MDINVLSYQPIKLKHNRVWRTYTGGKLLDKWQGNKNPSDSNKPEEWVASTVTARNPNPILNEGLSEVDLGSKENILLRDIVSSNPQAFLGEEHTKKYGNNMGVLVKMLDSYSRLIIQVHPDKEYAKNIMNSDFGKTEAWYILGGRTIDGEPPYVYFGFKPGITKQIWKQLFEKQDIEGMLNSLQKFYVKPGDTILIEGGVPHAIGSGCFLLEIQEPTDYTMRVEKIKSDGTILTDEMLHQGVGFDKMLDCFHYESMTKEELRNKWFLNPSTIYEGNEGKIISIISYKNTQLFAMDKIEVENSLSLSITEDKSFSVAVVLEGKGKIKWDRGDFDICQGDELFLPANLRNYKFNADEGQNLHIIKCYPPLAY